MPALCQDAVSYVVTLPLRGPLAGQRGLKSVLPETVLLDMPQRRPLVLSAFLFTIYVCSFGSLSFHFSFTSNGLVGSLAALQGNQYIEAGKNFMSQNSASEVLS